MVVWSRGPSRAHCYPAQPVTILIFYITNKQTNKQASKQASERAHASGNTVIIYFIHGDKSVIHSFPLFAVSLTLRPCMRSSIYNCLLPTEKKMKLLPTTLPPTAVEVQKRV